MSNIQNNPLLMGLAGAVLNPGLRTILVYDAPYYGLQQIASYLSTIMRSLDHKIVTTQLGSTEHDDHLWGSIPLPSVNAASHQTKVQFKHLLFSRQQNKDHIELILIPNLAEISLAVARAGIMQMGANVVHLERNWQSEVWQPQQYWLASCSKNDIGSVSSHLVDRFALRLKWQESSFSIDHRLRMRHLQQQLTSNENSLNLSAADYTQIQALVNLIKTAQKHHPQTTLETITSALDYFSEDLSPEQLYHRHEITLARYAVTLAQLSGANSVDKQHVADAATLMGLSKKEAEDKTNIPGTATNEEGQKVSTPKPGPMEESRKKSIDQEPEEKSIKQGKKEQVTAEVQKETVTPLTQSILAPENPYLEDSEPMLHEEDSLRLPLRRYTLGRADHGTIVGVERGSSFRDIAIVSTILHAALFSKLRQSTIKQPKRTTRIYITQEDLHHYRRSPAPEHMLLLLLDYTSLKRCDWQEALLPYLSRAYIRRASISIIKVGAQDAQHELQAEIVSARNMLVPSIAQALEATNGKTTPLAHGMQLALQTLQRNLQHGRNTVQYVTLVVISDGRGNVPLQASIDKRVNSLVTREGIGDALKIAQEIHEMKHVESILLNPQPLHYTQLPITLADALGATIRQIPSSTIETGGTQ